MNDVEFICREMIAPTLMQELPERGLTHDPNLTIDISDIGIGVASPNFAEAAVGIKASEIRDAFKEMVVLNLTKKIYARAYEVPPRVFIKGAIFVLLFEVNIENFVRELARSSTEAVVICSPKMLTLLMMNGYPITNQNMFIDDRRVIIDPYANDTKPILICEPGWGSFNFDQVLIGDETLTTDFTFSLDEEKIASIGFL